MLQHRRGYDKGSPTTNSRKKRFVQELKERTNQALDTTMEMGGSGSQRNSMQDLSERNHHRHHHVRGSTRSVTSSTQGTDDSERDEIQEVRNQSSKETARVRMWRLVVTIALLVTAVAVTVTTYLLLVREQDEKFRNVYDQFARAVADAAIEQQLNLREALSFMSKTIALSAKIQGNGTSPWPYFIPTDYECLARDFKKLANAEFIAFQNYVTDEQRDSYIEYITPRYQGFVQEAHMIAYGHLNNLNNDTKNYQPYIAQKLANKSFAPDKKRDHYFCRTVQSPPSRKYGPTINNNLIADQIIGDGFAAVMKLYNESVTTPIKPFANLPEDEHRKMHSSGGANNPHSFTFHPCHREPNDPTSDIVAMFAVATAWDVSMLNLLPDNVKGMFCVLHNTCNQTVTYRIDGGNATYLGKGDLHTRDYDDMKLWVDLNLQEHPDARSTDGHCMYSMTIYPSQDFEADYKTNTPFIFAGVVAGTFVMVALVYLIYDLMVQNRNEKMIANAAKASAIVTELVPSHLRDRLLQDKGEEQRTKGGKSGNLKSFLNNGSGGADTPEKPLADLFLDTTVVFADISGFTAWSSVREPTQVFTLLETLFQAFDAIARKLRVFKVETVGDCYVAVCGLPEPRDDHATTMARFARSILRKMRYLTKELEVTLGPDTGDLDLRIGMHSGPVTAGLLRGERTRFQLFGDTMNTCARLESSGKRGQIHISRETAEHIIAAGKKEWLEQRSDPQNLKGKGSIETFWLFPKAEQSAASTDSVDEESQSEEEPAVGMGQFGPKDASLDNRTNRLIDWNVEMLLNLLKQVVARRNAVSSSSNLTIKVNDSTFLSSADDLPNEVGAGIPLEEVREIIALPEFDEKAASKQQHPEQVEIPDDVVRQLYRLVSKIAGMYNNNPFHNFDHASHVVMSVIKLMSRIVAPANLKDGEDEEAAATLHDHTYGITSDPLTQFACAFSALIHDVDHSGVSNAQLVKEGVPLVAQYGERSVAEQNSLDLSWELMMCPEYDTLRAFLFPTKADMVRFRQLVVNSVMSTDIVDKQMKELRNGRWAKAFKTEDGDNKAPAADENPRDSINRKATIVIEHIIQASDISHTMQHWHVYRKWNQKLFEELYVAYLNGRMEGNPVDFWYKGEFGFFDFYIIPLTQKLKDCGVFGVSSGEFLDFATKNRAEWEDNGEELVAQMYEECTRKYGVKGSPAVVPSSSSMEDNGMLLEQAPDLRFDIPANGEDIC